MANATPRELAFNENPGRGHSCYWTPHVVIAFKHGTSESQMRAYLEGLGFKLDYHHTENNRNIYWPEGITTDDNR